MEAGELKLKIEAALAGAQVEVKDLTGGGDHFEALVVTADFEGRSLVERHQMVYRALGDAMRQQVHALSLKTLTPSQYRPGR
ncbi:MAG: BolA family protein [Candidatus Binataceae bacterium]|jgi:stress-induced morphogen